MKNIIIYDDFYANPIEVRNLALNNQFEESPSGNYPGVNSHFKFYPDDMTDFFCYLSGEKIKPVQSSHYGGFRIQNAGQTGKQYIHVDLPSMTTTWAAVCYLSLPEHYTKEDGTTFDSGSKFWKHKKTGMEQMPYDTEYLASIGLHSPNDLKDFMDTEGIDESKWINTMSVPIKFNRLIMFRSNLWHSQGELFGSDMHNGRLIQTFFFEPDYETSKQ